MRSLGGSIGLAVCVIVFNKKIRASDALTRELDPDELSALFKSPLVISSFNPKQQALVAKVYAKAFTQEMKVATYIAAACFLISLLTWQSKEKRPQRQSLQSATVSSTMAEDEQNGRSQASEPGV